MLNSNRQRTAEELLLIRANNIKNWNDEDRAFYEDLFDAIPEDSVPKTLNVPNEFVEESWKSFNELNQKLLSTPK